MLIHSSKATRDLEERLPEDLTADQRDAAIGLLLALRLGIQRDPVEDLLTILNDLALHQRAHRRHEQATHELRMAFLPSWVGRLRGMFGRPEGSFPHSVPKESSMGGCPQRAGYD